MRYCFEATIAILLVVSASALELPKETSVGVYITDGSEWLKAPVETVNWKPGGVVKHVVSEGMIREDLNGLIPGEASSVALPRSAKIQILIHTAEGIGAGEYRLLRLHSHTDVREFQSLIGGFRAFGDGQRDVVPYKAALVAPNTWRADLTGLPDGEYGLLAPVNAPAPATPAKIYTFGKCDLCNSPWSHGYTKSSVKKLVLNPKSPAFDYR